MAFWDRIPAPSHCLKQTFKGKWNKGGRDTGDKFHLAVKKGTYKAIQHTWPQMNEDKNATLVLEPQKWSKSDKINRMYQRRQEVFESSYSQNMGCVRVISVFSSPSRGNRAFKRISKAKSISKNRTPLPGLPINFYSPQWLQASSSRFQRGVKAEVPLPIWFQTGQVLTGPPPRRAQAGAATSTWHLTGTLACHCHLVTARKTGHDSAMMRRCRDTVCEPRRDATIPTRRGNATTPYGAVARPRHQHGAERPRRHGTMVLHRRRAVALRQRGDVAYDSNTAWRCYDTDAAPSLVYK
ncbi:hypothetical protein EDB84DRAFT_1446971 [Lactarius hengduanensis]|nr:hypothetical protein EDB84DRAFT_1446971 [Lactarius hengduanensis]